jgi:DNA-binding NarL/FixJ family response regulator
VIRVMLVDDEQLMRAGLRLILANAPDIEVVAEAGDGADAIELAACHQIDVALMDIRMPRMDGLTATERLTLQAPAVRVLILSTFGEDEYVINALAAGAAGFVLKATGARELIEAVRVVAGGEAILSPQITRSLIARHVVGNASRAARAQQVIDKLTDRERDVLVLVGLGLSNAEAGRRLYLGEGTVKSHVRHILTKTGCANRVQAAILAHEAGLLAVPDPGGCTAPGMTRAPTPGSGGGG